MDRNSPFRVVVGDHLFVGRSPAAASRHESKLELKQSGLKLRTAGLRPLRNFAVCATCLATRDLRLRTRLWRLVSDLPRGSFLDDDQELRRAPKIDRRRNRQGRCAGELVVAALL